ncbi:barstar family protein [Streptomyces laurentii]|uniref:barstar family protein n=1 Tax=Streptomyces laurentii TaxID=39478 RepID=UPI003683E5AE
MSPRKPQEPRETRTSQDPREPHCPHDRHEPPTTQDPGLAALGRPVVLDLHGVTDKAAFMDRCAAALALPAWFGRNWDALAESLTDLPGRVALVVTGWQAYAEAQPAEWRTAQEVFATSVAERPTRLTVLLSLGDLPATLGGSDERPSASLG